MNWHRISYKRLVVLMLPIILRNRKLMDYLDCLLTPINNLYRSFLSIRNDTEYKLNHNSQVCYLRAMLNDNFDLDDRDIYIIDIDLQEWSRFLWTELEDKPIMLGVFILNRESFIGVDAIDFVVRVPKRLNLTTNDYVRMNALIRYYKLASKRYIIEEYE